MTSNRARELRLLLVEDDRRDAELTLLVLERAGYSVDADLVTSPDRFSEQLERRSYDVVLADYRLPQWTGMDALALLREQDQSTPLILVTGSLDDEHAIECLKAGVADYVLKDNLARLPVAVRRVIEDLTVRDERSRAMAALRASEEQFRLLLESTGEGIYGLDTEGACTFCNPAAAHMLGYAGPEDLLRTNIHELTHRTRADGSVYPGSECSIHCPILTGAGQHVEDEVFWRPDGTSFQVECWSYQIKKSGDVIGSVVTFNDITEKRALENQVRQSQKMEAIGRLAGGVAHDFNNLLTVIMTYTDMLKDGLGPRDPRCEDVDEIKKAALGAASLTRQLLAFSRQQVIQPRVVPLNDIVENSEKMLRRLIGEDVKLVTSLTNEPITVMIDPGQLEQVILNLVVNARDAMPTGGKLTLATESVEMDAEFARDHWPARPGSFALLAVTDTGIGMDEDTQGRIFEPFYTTKGPGKGTGLGLATVYGIVKQSNGFIWVSSEPGKGTTFEIYIPLVDEAVERSENAEPKPVGGRETVLLAEDAAAVRIAARQILERNGYTVLEAPTGREALILATRRDGPIDLLLTDMVMPEMSGRELAERFAQARPKSKVLFMSGYTDDAVLRHGGLPTGTTYLQKPFAPDTLARKVREVLDSARGPKSSSEVSQLS
ncbi:MAG TPA: response regulator [Gemmatimonadaceae bacterium]|nr:response regulator [Gemmatimonadaceae bacterium]